MFTQCAGLDIRLLWFQALKRDRQAWQKGNASMQPQTLRKLQSSGKICWVIFGVTRQILRYRCMSSLLNCLEERSVTEALHPDSVSIIHNSRAFVRHAA